MLDQLCGLNADLLCLTEAYEGFIPGGYEIASEADHGYPIQEGRRKVILWSKHPWEAVDQIGHPSLPRGRYIRGTVSTSFGPLAVIGICIPWKSAHVATGRRDRQVWEDHLSFLEGLQAMLRDVDGPHIVLGDFNQRIPRKYTPDKVHNALLECIGPDRIVETAGIIEPLGRQSIDHIVSSRDLSMSCISALDNEADGIQLSDHFGLVGQLTPADGAAKKQLA